MDFNFLSFCGDRVESLHLFSVLSTEQVPAPHLIFVLRPFHRATVLAVTASAFSPLPQRVPQAFLSPQPLHPLLVDPHTFSLQQPGHRFTNADELIAGINLLLRNRATLLGMMQGNYR
jgi:hypothetical protein